MYSDEGLDWKKERDLPPKVLQEFERVWDSAAPERCLECNKRAAPGRKHPMHVLGKAYCSQQCSDAGFVVKCKRCTLERKCAFCNMKAAPLGERWLDNMEA